MSLPDLLFLTGLGRSGTTALADLFATHPHVAMGMERYKALYPNGAPEVGPHLFTRERFFDFDDGSTNIRPDVHPRWKNYYEAQGLKWDDVRYVGDKVTRIIMDKLWDTLPDARFVCIIRHIRPVAASWERRATNPADTAWSSTSGARAAVLSWNTGLRRIARASTSRPEHVAVIEYERFFGDPDAHSLRTVLDWLDLEGTPEFMQQFAETHRRHGELAARRTRPLSPDDVAYIHETANMKLWRRLRRQAI